MGEIELVKQSRELAEGQGRLGQVAGSRIALCVQPLGEMEKAGRAPQQLTGLMRASDRPSARHPTMSDVSCSARVDMAAKGALNLPA